MGHHQHHHTSIILWVIRTYSNLSSSNILLGACAVVVVSLMIEIVKVNYEYEWRILCGRTI